MSDNVHMPQAQYKHIVMFSGGVGSWYAAKRVVAQHGGTNVLLLFTDTGIEDETLYEFIGYAGLDVGALLVRIADGRTPWDLFFAHKMLGNSRVDICSRVLKRELADAWLDAHCAREDTTIYLGIDWSEVHRFDDGNGRGAKWRYARNGWKCEAPCTQPP